MKKVYIEAFAVFVSLAAILVCSFKSSQSNEYLAGIIISTFALVIYGVSLGISMANQFGDKK